MPSTTRTLNPLHFEDLEPKRFEDLVRQLAYDFRNWRRLEATGRAGSDEGFDARGYERIAVEAATLSYEDENENDDSEQYSESSERLWLIQCKREKSLPPAKMRAHLANIRVDLNEPIYGVIFAAACDFSKSTRDVLVEWCRENGISEWHLWGKAELEDQLLQPKNDGILFAYFGISLVIRRRSQISETRRQLAIKKKIKRLLEMDGNRRFLLRDVDDDSYPHEREGAGRWKIRRVVKICAQGIEIEISMRYAWLSFDGNSWDSALGAPGMAMSAYEDPWYSNSDELDELNRQASNTWGLFDDSEKAWTYCRCILPYSEILLIDDVGDDWFDGPHLYVTGWSSGYQLGAVYIETISHPSRSLLLESGASQSGRVVKFPEATRSRAELSRVFRTVELGNAV